MQENVPPNEKLFSVFDGFVEKIFPDLFNQERDMNLLELHREIIKSIPFTSIGRQNNPDNVPISLLKIRYNLPDMDREEIIEIPVVWRNSKMKIHPKSFLPDFDKYNREDRPILGLIRQTTRAQT